VYKHTHKWVNIHPAAVGFIYICVCVYVYCVHAHPIYLQSHCHLRARCKFPLPPVKGVRLTSFVCFLRSWCIYNIIVYSVTGPWSCDFHALKAQSSSSSSSLTYEWFSHGLFAYIYIYSLPFSPNQTHTETRTLFARTNDVTKTLYYSSPSTPPDCRLYYYYLLLIVVVVVV